MALVTGFDRSNRRDCASRKNPLRTRLCLPTRSGISATHFLSMSKKTSNAPKSKKNEETQLLALLKKVLPKATTDADLAGKIYEAFVAELRAKNQATSFSKFCDRVPLPDLEPKTLDEVKLQFASAFSEGDVTISPNKKEKSLSVEVVLPDGSQFTKEIKVRDVPPEGSDEQEIVLKFVPFPVSLPGDPELAWLLAKRENMSPDEAGIALSKAEEEFWASKPGQKSLRDRVERNFPEFISRAPAGLLNEVGLKRHYKTPEPIRIHKGFTPQKSKKD